MANALAGLMYWPLIIAWGSRRWFGCTRMRSALKRERRSGNIFTGTPDAVQFKVPRVVNPAWMTQNIFEEDGFAGVA